MRMVRPRNFLYIVLFVGLLFAPGCQCRVSIGPKAAAKPIKVTLPGRVLKITASTKIGIKAARDTVTVTLAAGKVVITNSAIEVNGARVALLDATQTEIELAFTPETVTANSQGRNLLNHTW